MKKLNRKTNIPGQYTDEQPERRGMIRRALFRERRALGIPMYGDPDKDGTFSNAAVEKAVDIIINKKSPAELEQLRREEKAQWQRERTKSRKEAS